jgi:hypothetical protein
MLNRKYLPVASPSPTPLLDTQKLIFSTVLGAGQPARLDLIKGARREGKTLKRAVLGRLEGANAGGRASVLRKQPQAGIVFNL